MAMPIRHRVRMLSAWTAACVIVTSLSHAQEVQQFPLTDATGLVARDVTLEAVEYLGRKAVRVTKATPGAGLAFLPGTDFQDGSIEADIAVNVTTPPGARMPGFIGLAFRARPDATQYELFYLRPGNSRAEDQAMRNHAVQYSAAPDFGWYRLRRQWPWVCETHADLEPAAWTQVKITVAGRTASLFLNGSTAPSLIIDGLKSPNLRGAVALWGFSGEEAYFSNIRITPATPQPIKNGSDAAGQWQVKASTDALPMEGVLRLTRQGSAITGEWSGTFGEKVPVSGTWRDGYIELTVAGQWPKEAPGGPGPAVVTFAGWIDAGAAKGRMKIEDRADGTWSATKNIP